MYRKVSISNGRGEIPKAPGTRMSNEWDYLEDGKIKEQERERESQIAIELEIFIKAHKFPFYFNLSEIELSSCVVGVGRGMRVQYKCRLCGR